MNGPVTQNGDLTCVYAFVGGEVHSYCFTKQGGDLWGKLPEVMRESLSQDGWTPDDIKFSAVLPEAS